MIAQTDWMPTNTHGVQNNFKYVHKKTNIIIYVIKMTMDLKKIEYLFVEYLSFWFIKDDLHKIFYYNAMNYLWVSINEEIIFVRIVYKG